VYNPISQRGNRTLRHKASQTGHHSSFENWKKKRRSSLALNTEKRALLMDKSADVSPVLLLLSVFVRYERVNNINLKSTTKRHDRNPGFRFT